MTETHRQALVFFSLVLLCFIFDCAKVIPALAANKVDTRGEAELRLCTQNLEQYGAPPPALAGKKQNRKGKSAEEFRQEKEDFLIARLLAARCDVVAVQEVHGASSGQAGVNLRRLAARLAEKSGRRFESFVGETLRQPIFNGFLVALDAVEVEAVDSSYNWENLPKLQPLGPSRKFMRSPLGITLKVRGKNGKSSRRIFLLNIHLKSKRDGWKDPTGSDYETSRMEMAEKAREIAVRKGELRGEEDLEIILGDRNSTAQSASAEILSGTLQLSDFFNKYCRLFDREQVKCKQGARRAPQFVGLFAKKGEEETAFRYSGSFSYRQQLAFIDEILVETKHLWIFRNERKVLAAGLEGVFRKGSDHKLLWTELNW